MSAILGKNGSFGQNFWCGTFLGANSGVAEFWPKILGGAILGVACLAVQGQKKSLAPLPGEILAWDILWVKIVWLYTFETLTSACAHWFGDRVRMFQWAWGFGWAIWVPTGGWGDFWARILL